MIGVNSKQYPYTVFLSKEEIDAISLALSDSIDMHEEYDIYSRRTVDAMRQVLFDIRDLVG